jgi:predicted PolB exonuclease-like 3'-5' exonuclease
MRLGVTAPAFHRRDGEWRWNHYENRYHDMHVDVMDVLSGYGASPRAGLEVVAESLGLPGKGFLAKDLHDHMLAGEHDVVVDYCKLDTLVTMLVFLKWAEFAGRATAEDAARGRDALLDAVDAERNVDWRKLGDALRGRVVGRTRGDVVWG